MNNEEDAKLYNNCQQSTIAHPNHSLLSHKYNKMRDKGKRVPIPSSANTTKRECIELESHPMNKWASTDFDNTIQVIMQSDDPFYGFSCSSHPYISNDDGMTPDLNQDASFQYVAPISVLYPHLQGSPPVRRDQFGSQGASIIPTVTIPIYGQTKRQVPSSSNSLQDPAIPIIPPPPLVPIINPVIMKYNTDVGTDDLQYISEDAFCTLNSYTKEKPTIPRSTACQGTTRAIPALIPQVSLSPNRVVTSDALTHRHYSCDYLNSVISDATNENKRQKENSYFNHPIDIDVNGNKVVIRGFSWESSEVNREDPWIK